MLSPIEILHFSFSDIILSSLPANLSLNIFLSSLHKPSCLFILLSPSPPSPPGFLQQSILILLPLSLLLLKKKNFICEKVLKTISSHTDIPMEHNPAGSTPVLARYVQKVKT